MDLAEARGGRRLRDHRAQARKLSDTNRSALARLFMSGLIYSRTGARLGRDLLQAHQHLLKVGDLLAQVEELPAHGAVEGDGAAEALYAEVSDLLARVGALTARSDGLLARER